MENVIKKALLPLAFMIFWMWTVNTIMKVSGCHELVIWLFLAGLPFGVHKMCFLLIPKGMDLGGTIGMVALSVIVGGVMGCVMIPYYLIRAVYVLIQYLFRSLLR